jgi:hypothetical protein
MTVASRGTPRLRVAALTTRQGHDMTDCASPWQLGSEKGYVPTLVESALVRLTKPNGRQLAENHRRRWSQLPSIRYYILWGNQSQDVRRALGGKQLLSPKRGMVPQASDRDKIPNPVLSWDNTVASLPCIEICNASVCAG